MRSALGTHAEPQSFTVHATGSSSTLNALSPHLHVSTGGQEQQAVRLLLQGGRHLSRYETRDRGALQPQQPPPAHTRLDHGRFPHTHTKHFGGRHRGICFSLLMCDAACAASGPVLRARRQDGAPQPSRCVWRRHRWNNCTTRITSPVLVTPLTLRHPQAAASGL